MSRTTLVTLTALAFATVAPAAAQSRRMEQMDTNRDGVITRSEWRGNARQFESRDWNNDGVLSGDELSGRNDRSNNNNNDRYSDSRNNGTYGEGSRSRAASNLDRNNNGVVEGYEWPYNANVFHQLDTNGDSVLEPNELANMNRATLSQLDRNHNGQVDQNEWPGGFAQFGQLDENRDGRVSSQEYFGRGGEWQRRQRFDAWDKNHDGIIESTEWKSGARLFHELDTDHDSRVSWNEFMASRERYDQPYGWEQR